MLYKDTFWIDDKYLDIFTGASLGDSKVFYNNDVGELIREEPEKKIRYFKIDSNGLNYGFYIKTESPNLLSQIKHLIKKRKFYRLSTRHELDLIRLYQSQGVSVVEPVALSEKYLLGIPIRGFLIQREVVGQELVDLMRGGTSEERIKLVKAYGKFVADLHSKGLISTVPRATDLICTSSLDIKWQNITLVVIDREKGPLQLERFSIDKVGHALSSILVRFIIYIDVPSTKEVLCFLRAYLKYLQVDHKPSLRNIYSITVRNFNIMRSKYRNQIDHDNRLSCVLSDRS